MNYDECPIIRDLISGHYFKIYNTELLKVTIQLLDTVEVYDKGNDRTYKFRTGDALLAGIQIPQEQSLFSYANKNDEFQHGDINESSTKEDSEKLT